MTLCTSNFCNSAAFVLRICYSCTGIKRTSKCHNIGPKNNLQLTSYCPHRMDHRNGISCYTMLFPNQTIHRGCISTLSRDAHAECHESLNKNCFICEGDRCNKVKYFQDKCFKCVDCSEINRVVYQRQCDVLSSPLKRGCFTWRSLNGKRRRGCVGELTAFDFRICRKHPDLCKICKGDGCNSLQGEVNRSLKKDLKEPAAIQSAYHRKDASAALLIVMLFMLGLGCG